MRFARLGQVWTSGQVGLVGKWAVEPAPSWHLAPPAHLPPPAYHPKAEPRVRLHRLASLDDAMAYLLFMIVDLFRFRFRVMLGQRSIG